MHKTEFTCVHDKTAMRHQPTRPFALENRLVQARDHDQAPHLLVEPCNGELPSANRSACVVSRPPSVFVSPAYFVVKLRGACHFLTFNSSICTAICTWELYPSSSSKYEPSSDARSTSTRADRTSPS